MALCLCTVHSVEEESLQGLSSWDQSASSILQILRPAKHDPVTSKEGTVSVELELRGAEGTLLAVEINGGEWSLWTADASCGSPDHLCTVHVHHVRPGPIRLNVALLDVRGVHVAEASVFFFCDGEFYRGDLLARNPWIEDHTWQRRRPAVASVNLAHRGEAHQQSTAFSAHANLAVDGRTESDFSQGSCSHTNVPSPGGFGDGPADPWWTVALRGGMGSVRSVTIHNRRDCQECSESLRGFHVLLSNESLTAPLHGLVEDGDGSAGALEGRLSYLLELRGGEGVVECGETWLLSEEDLTGPVTLECRGTPPPNVVTSLLLASPLSCAQASDIRWCVRACVQVWRAMSQSGCRGSSAPSPYAKSKSGASASTSPRGAPKSLEVRRMMRPPRGGMR